jgi:hypothetical protein
MSTVSIHIEGHEDGSLDDGPDLAVALRYIADQLMNTPGTYGTVLPEEIGPGYVSPFDDETEPAAWSLQYGIY